MDSVFKTTKIKPKTSEKINRKKDYELTQETDIRKILGEKPKPKMTRLTLNHIAKKTYDDFKYLAKKHKFSHSKYFMYLIAREMDKYK